MQLATVFSSPVELEDAGQADHYTADELDKLFGDTHDDQVGSVDEPG